MKGQALPPRLRIGKPEPLACLPRWMLCDHAHSYERWPCSVGDRDRQRRRRRLCAGAGPAGQLLVRACYSAFDHTALELLLTELECERILLCGAATATAARSTPTPS